MEAEVNTAPEEVRPAEIACSQQTRIDYILSQLDEYRLRVVVAFAEELLRD